MLPTKLIISAFGSYPDEETIDFSALGKNGVYLITGETGAGKTTIFDAITFALYDVSSGSKETKLLRSQYADEKRKTYVDLYFDHKGKHYRIFRCLKMTDGKKAVKGTDELSIYTIDDHGTELCINSDKKLKESNQLIISLLGVDDKQFKQIALLSQGEFVKLVEAKSNERKEIFSKIFDTSIFLDIEAQIKADHDLAKNKVTEQCSVIRAVIGGTAANEKHASEHRALLEEIASADSKKTSVLTADDTARAIALITSIIEDDKSDKKSVEADIGKTERNIDEKKHLIETETRAAEYRASLGSLNERQKKLSADKESANKKLLEARSFEKEIRTLREEAAKEENSLGQYRRLSDTKAQLEKISRQLFKAKNDQSSFIARAEGLRNDLKAASEKTDELKDAPIVLERAKGAKADAARRSEAARQLSSAHDDAVSARAALAAVQKDLISAENSYLNALRDCTVTAMSDAAYCEEQSVMLEDRIRTCDEAIEKTDKMVSELAKAEGDRSAWEAELKSVRVSESKIRQLYDEKLPKYREICKKSGENYIKVVAAREKKDSCEQLFNRLNDAYHQNTVWQIASELTENAPCPVCGSTHHPKIAEKPDHAPQKSEVDEARSCFLAADKEYRAAERTQAEFDSKREAQLAALSESMSEISGSAFEVQTAEAQLRSLIGIYSGKRREAEEKLAKADADIKKRAELSDKCAQLRETKKKLTDELEKINSEKSEKNTRVKLLGDQLSRAISDVPTICRRAALTDDSLIDTHPVAAAAVPQKIGADTSIRANTLMEQFRRSAEELLDKTESQLNTLRDLESRFAEKIRQYFGGDNEKPMPDDIASLIASETDRAGEELAAATEDLLKAEEKCIEKERAEKLCRQLESDIDQLDRNIRTAENEITQLETNQTATGNAADELQKRLRFDDEQKAAEYIRKTRSEADRRNAAIESADAAFRKIAGELTLLKGQITQLEEHLKSTPSAGELDKLNLELSELEAERTSLGDKLIEINTRLSMNRNRLTALKNAEEKRAAAQKEAEMTDILRRTITGKLNGKDKLSLETYVQIRYFDAVIANANTRLRRMSNGQYELTRRKIADTLKGGFGLDLDIIDYYCEIPEHRCRDVNSISGGEKFKVALSLALGLSDEIMRRAGAVRFDTLFVDEGFGSLDAESLKLALDVLSELSSADERLIGIISHVDMLKDSIDKKIVVKKNKSRGSSARIVIG